MEKFEILYDNKIVKIQKIRYDFKLKTNVFVLDNDEATLLPINIWSDKIISNN